MSLNFEGKRTGTTMVPKTNSDSNNIDMANKEYWYGGRQYEIDYQDDEVGLVW